MFILSELNMISFESSFDEQDEKRPENKVEVEEIRQRQVLHMSQLGLQLQATHVAILDSEARFALPRPNALYSRQSSFPTNE